jgi:hypothetical protein
MSNADKFLPTQANIFSWFVEFEFEYKYQAESSPHLLSWAAKRKRNNDNSSANTQ